jgi:hypothetical protein
MKERPMFTREHAAMVMQCHACQFGASGVEMCEQNGPILRADRVFGAMNRKALLLLLLLLL